MTRFTHDFLVCLVCHLQYQCLMLEEAIRRRQLNNLAVAQVRLQ